MLLTVGALIAFGAVRVRRKKKRPWPVSPPTLPAPAPRQDNPRHAAVPPHYQHPSAPGQRIAGYRLVEQVGRGGMAMVFLAHDEGLGRPVALKILTPELAGDPEFRQRFVRESRAAAALDDPHIIPVFQAGQDGGVLFIAMRYVSGGDVRTALERQGPMSIERTTSIISPAASLTGTGRLLGTVDYMTPCELSRDFLPICQNQRRAPELTRRLGSPSRPGC